MTFSISEAPPKIDIVVPFGAVPSDHMDVVCTGILFKITHYKQQLSRNIFSAKNNTLKLTFAQIQEIAGIPIDHSFLKCKKELTDYAETPACTMPSYFSAAVWALFRPQPWRPPSVLVVFSSPFSWTGAEENLIEDIHE
mgnify:CR=1 FL=1